MSMGDVEILPSEAPVFLPGPDIVISLDLPVPLSVNRTRKVDWSHKRKIDEWKTKADMMVLASGGVRRLGKIPGKFEARIVLDEQKCRVDADNTAKLLIDYCRRLNLVIDDSKKFMRRLIIEWGDAPTGCRIILREFGA